MSNFKILLSGLRTDSRSILTSFSIGLVLNHSSPWWFMEINISRIWGAKTWKGRKLVSSARLSELVAWSWGTATRGNWLRGSGDPLAWLVKIPIPVLPWEFQTIHFEEGQWATLIYALNCLGGGNLWVPFHSLEPTCCLSDASDSSSLKADPTFYRERHWITSHIVEKPALRGLLDSVVDRHSLRWGAKGGYNTASTRACWCLLGVGGCTRKWEPSYLCQEQ